MAPVCMKICTRQSDIPRAFYGENYDRIMKAKDTPRAFYGENYDRIMKAKDTPRAFYGESLFLGIFKGLNLYTHA